MIENLSKEQIAEEKKDAHVFQSNPENYTNTSG